LFSIFVKKAFKLERAEKETFPGELDANGRTDLSRTFPRWINRLPLLLVACGGSGLFGMVGFVWYYFSPWFTDVGYAPEQPVQYSHKLHAGDLGIDCRYCHSNVERSPYANIPPTQTCMNCHANVRPDSPLLAAVRESWADDRPIPWVRIHMVPDYAHFDHSVHVARGVGCVSCHGRIDQMPIVRQEKPLSMGWCLECHRNPERYVRPVSEVTNMTYQPQTLDEGARLVRENDIRPPENCIACHY
jgi:hypothetical protein